MSEELTELPEGWKWVFFEEIIINYDGQRVPVSSSERKNRQGNFPYYGASGIIDYVDDYLFDGNYLLIAEDGANLLSRSTPIAFDAYGKFWVNNHAHVIKVVEELVLNAYLKNYINSTDLKFYISGSAQPKLNQKNLNSICIPLPPLNEQKRIVAKIEELNDRTQKTKQALDSIPQLCDRFRQSVLAAALQGDLTADWREENLDIEPASILLEKLKKRSPQLENDLSEYDLSDIPDSWIWINVESIGDVKGGKRLPKGESLVDENTGYPYIKAGNLKNGTVILSEIQFIPKHIQPLIKNYTVASGDVYITIVGACIGDAGIIPRELDGANLTENAAKICNLSGISNEYLSLWLRSSLCQEIIKSKILSAAQGKLALTRIKTLPIPLPPIQEQFEIISRVRGLLNFTVRMTQCYMNMNPKLDQLNQSILAKAFRGELVPQDPDDEPASVLLERIQAERDKLDNSKPKSDRTSKSKTVEGQTVIPGLE